ncbi:beta-ketoacyl synthase chain length factor [Granulosicoccus antarcticus]|uniref:Beta-ketoacyl synthase-like N-terminal domain-containing protein n=1 Tax=Granulosicoccus antarcticus IMCC3135 TaxID=1192854 RepID=A0A2Z2NZI8_9GAMM|nr:beta-ketoacyl synthase chain length factor [Granulosicoccus antarcticus]ASJ76846.1 hypothetical protein IMCC3135_34030 [Granulosicoccus antarcticus IMCC3135]
MLTGSSTNHANGESLYASLVMENWLGWSEDGDSSIAVPQHYLLPQRDSVPASLRRRLSPVGLATCSILSSLAGDSDIPVIYVSRHGRAGNTLLLLRELANEGSISPSRFSLSVHNAVAGIYSIANKHLNSIQAISASGDELQALALEAIAYLRTGTTAVVAVFAEEAFPDHYKAYTSGPNQGCVVGMRLSLNPDLQLYPDMPPLPDKHGSNPLDVLQWLGSYKQCKERTL